ncbi:MAG: hypothetical protein NTW15_10775 [Burkholderiales bacterium]|nr:hypothetical protein [Burkholderiales bacterium]
MTASSRLAAALLGPARFLVWGLMVALVLLAAGTPGRDVMSSAVAIDPTEFLAYGTSDDPAPSADLHASEMRTQHAVTVAEIVAGSVEGGRVVAGCRERSPWAGSGIDAVVCDMPASLADLSEHEPSAAGRSLADLAWVRIGRAHAPPDPAGRTPAPALRPPSA